MAINFETVSEAIRHFEGEGRELTARQRSAKAISGAMVAAWLREQGHGVASPVTIAKYINIAKNAGLRGRRAEAGDAPLDGDTLARLDQILAGQRPALVALIQGVHQAAIKAAREREKVHVSDEAELQESATVRLAEAEGQLAALRAELAEAQELAAKATGRADTLASHLERANKALETQKAEYEAKLAATEERAKQAAEGSAKNYETLWQTYMAQRDEARAQAKTIADQAEALGALKAQATSLTKELERFTHKRGEARAVKVDSPRGDNSRLTPASVQAAPSRCWPAAPKEVALKK